MSEWHLITSEYPPQPGGVSDYTQLVASGLAAAAGDRVHVWCPPCGGEKAEARGVSVHRELGRFTPTDLRRVGRLLDQFAAPRRLLVQYVPHGYGYRSMNIPFCLWLWKRAALAGDEVEIMVHEPYLAFGEGTWKQNAVAVVHRAMTVVLLRAAQRVWMSIPAWETRWRPYAFGRRVPFTWLPVPSTAPFVDDTAGVAAARACYAPEGSFLVGHFGTCGQHIAVFLKGLLPQLLMASTSPMSLLLMGRGGERVRDEILRVHPRLVGRLHATGGLDAEDLSRHLAACDLLVQPYPDGVSSRRTSVMAGLAHGLPLVTTSGHLTEDLWAESGAVEIVPAGNAAAMVEAVERLLTDAAERRRLGVAARALYHNRFDVMQTVAALRGAATEAATSGILLASQ